MFFTIMHNTKSAILLDKVAKTYPLFSRPNQLIGYCLGYYNKEERRNKLGMFSALKDISFDIKVGERVALVGRNGAGKTTLLKLLMGNFAPSAGLLQVNGRVMSLMSGVMGESMNPSFTGLENLRVKLHGNGYSGKGFNDALEEALDFVELGEYIYQPLSTYSMGMAARLAFAAATAIRPEILLIDEVLGAGDSYFLEKCARRIERISNQGCTLILVSHSTQQLLRFCERAIWLRDHTVYMDGPAYSVLQHYDADVEWSAEREVQNCVGESAAVMRSVGSNPEVLCYPGKVGVKIENCWFDSSHGPTMTLTCSQQDPLTLHIALVAEENLAASLRYIVSFWSPRGLRAASMENEIDTFTLQKGERRTVHFHMEQCLLEAGEYPVSLSVYDVASSGLTSDAPGNGRHDVLVAPLSVNVLPRDSIEGFALPAYWS